VDPSNWPTIALFNYDITDTDAEEQTVKRSLFSAMAVVDRSVSWSWGLKSNNPTIDVSLREWV